MEVSPEYVAGFFDGEGHLDKKGLVNFTQRDPTILYAIQRRYGGTLSRKNKGTMWRLRIDRPGEGRFFQEVTPYSFRLGGVVPMVNHPSLSNRRWQRNAGRWWHET